MTVTIMTAAYGDDMLQDQHAQNIPGVRWLALTDHDRHDDTTWEKVQRPYPYMSPRMASKIGKYMPGVFVDEGTPVIWIDASVQIIHPGFVRRFLQPVIDATGALRNVITMIPHPDRSSIAEEWPEAKRQGRYAGQMIEEQATSYLADPDFVDNALWATTIIGRIVTMQTEGFGGAWMCENVTWTAQDQISCPYVAQMMGQEIWPVYENLWSNKYFTLRERKEDK